MAVSARCTVTEATTRTLTLGSTRTPSNGVSLFDHDPNVSAFDLSPRWRPEVAPYVLVFTESSEALSPPPNIDLHPFLESRDPVEIVGRPLVVPDPDGDHHLWIDDLAAIDRPAIRQPFDGDTPVRTQCVMRLYRRLAGLRAGPLPRALLITPLQRKRLIQQLHVADYLLLGAKPREIAADLLDKHGATLPAIEWKSSAIRRHVMRLIRESQALMQGNYLDLLRGR